MNQRIRELADKAIEDMPGAWNIPDEFCKKFAELIVQECFDVVINDGRFHDAKGIIQAGKGVAMEHFGVGE